MAFGITREELECWKEKVRHGEIALLTHYWLDSRFPNCKTVTKVGCSNVEKLIQWGKQYGLREEWIDHRTLYPHFDLFGIKQVEILFQEGYENHINKFRLPFVNEQHSLYAIHLRLSKNETIQIGKLGTFDFPKGTYIYVGSAKRNLRARIARHLRREKPYRWHFDYIRPYGEVIQFETFDQSLDECSRCRKLKETYHAVELIRGFGSSDCSCNTHLLYVGA